MEQISLTQKQPLLKQTAFISQRAWSFQPQGQLPLVNLSSTVRINLQGLKQGFMCPYSSYIKVIVALPSSTTIGCLTLDHPDALIQTFRIVNKGKEIQRTIQCNRLMSIMHSMGTIQARRNFVGSPNWGKGYQMMNPPNASGQAPLRGYLQPNTTATTINTVVQGGSTGYIPTQFQMPLYAGGNPLEIQSMCLYQQKATKSHINPYNPVYTDPNTLTQSGGSWLQAYLSTFNSAKNIRSQYIFNTQYYDRLQTTSSKNNNVQVVSTNTMSATSFPAKVGNTYQLTCPNNVIYNFIDPQTAYIQNMISATIPNQVSKTGYSNFTSPYFWKQDPGLVLSNTVNSVSFANGQFLTQRQPQNVAQIKLAIPSSQFGIFIPQNQYRRIPLSTLSQCSIQLTFNSAAFYSSGYCDGSQYDTQGMGVQVQRAYIITGIQLILDWYMYKSNLLYQNQLLNTSIYMQTYHYEQLLVQSFANASAINNVFLLSAPSGVLNELIIRITSNDYNQYNFCRRNYALSANITSLQIRHNGVYYPDAPYVGNGGNPTMSTAQSLTNSIFLQNLARSHLYRPNTTKINPYNFAVNQRVYDVTNTATLYDSALSYQVPAGSTSQMTQPINMDTAMGQSFLHQKRCCGQAVYIVPFNAQVMQGQVHVVSGLSTTMVSNIQLLVETNKTTNYNRPVVVQIIGVYSKVVVPAIQNQKKVFIIQN